MHDVLRVLTLNCWNVSEPFEARMALIRRGIEALAPDIIGLQEIIVRRDGFDQGAMLLRDLGYHWVFGPASRWDGNAVLRSWSQGGDAFGNVIATRWPIRRSAVRPLPGSETKEERSALAVHIDAPGGLVPVITTHFNWKYDHGYIRERQALALSDFALEWGGGVLMPVIVMGDLNADPDATEVRFLCGLQSLAGRSVYFQDAWRVAGDSSPGFTWDNRNGFAAFMHEPNRRIDYILVGLPDSSGRGSVESVRVVLNESHHDVFPSDHFGVLAEVRV